MTPTSNKTTYDVAVVGGGLAGLTAALYLARGGCSVVLYEKAEQAGGRAISQNHQGYLFNLGAHAVYEKTAGAQVLAELGIAYTAGEPQDVRAVTHDKIHDFPTGPRTLLTTSLLTIGEKVEAARALMLLTTAKPDAMRGTTLAQWLDRNTVRPSVRNLLEATARTITYTNAPEMLDMGLLVEQIAATTKGRVFYVDGGWQTLVDGLLDAARAAGVTIHTGARVQAVEQTNGRVTGIRLDNNRLVRANSVIVAGSPADASRLVDKGSHPSLQAWAEQAIPVRGACLDVALRRMPNSEVTVAAHMEKPYFLTAQSVYSKVAPEGGSLIYTIKYLHPDDHSDPKAHERELEGWLDLTQPGWRDLVVHRRFLPNLLVSNWVVSAQSGGLVGRPGPAVPGLVGLYVAGDWVGPGGLLFSASMWSARLASQAILASDAILKAA